MSDEREDLRLNTLHRFSKRSPRLVLEEYSHCEVPAGCGGVVLRWRDPDEGHPFRVRVASLGETELLVDGVRVEPVGATLRVGRHELVIHLTGLPEQESPLGIAIEAGGPRAGLRAALLTAASGGFLALAPDGTRQPLAPFADDLAAITGRRAWWFRRFAEEGALLALPPREARVHRTIEVLPDGRLA